MRHEYPSRENGDGPDRPTDEKRLYGEPCHEVRSGRAEQRLYGEPQHETREGDSELPELELLFARMRADAGVDRTTLSSAPPAETTEQ